MTLLFFFLSSTVALTVNSFLQRTIKTYIVYLIETPDRPDGAVKPRRQPGSSTTDKALPVSFPNHDAAFRRYLTLSPHFLFLQICSSFQI